MSSIHLITLINSVNKISCRLERSLYLLLLVHTCFDSWLRLPLPCAIGEDKHLFVDLVLVQDLVRCIYDLFGSTVSFVLSRIEVVWTQVGVHRLGEIRH